MKTFIQYITEKNALVAATLAGSLAAGQPVPPEIPQEQPQKATETEKIEKKEDPYEYFGGQHNVNLYRGLMSAEFRGRDIGDPMQFNKNLFVRTSAKPPMSKDGKQLVSSAFGPAQITYGTVSGMRKNKRTSDLFTGIDQSYLDKFETQGQQFIKAGNVKGGRYGLGGCGDLCTPENTQNYHKLAVAVMRGKMRELGIDDTKPLSEPDRVKFTKSWAGPHWSQTYYNAFNTGYGSTN